MKKGLTTKIILLVILALSFALRFFSLTSNPPSLSWDEVSHGYNAYSILKTGHDEWGQFMPITNFRAYGDYPTTLYMYLLMPIITVFGLTDFTVRLPSAILGSLMALVIYFLAKKIVKKESVALLAAFFIALSPWGILLSRQVLQATPAVFFMTLGILISFIAMEKKVWWSVLGAFLLGLSAYAYHNTRIYAPVLLLGLFFVYRKKLLANIRLTLAIVLCSAILFIPIFTALTSTEGSARSTWVGILDQGAINRINESRGNSKLSPFFSRLIHNKVTYFTQVAAKNYVGYFSPYFLATSGGSHYQFSIQGFGVLNPAELPLFYLGLFLLFKHLRKSSKESKFLLFWLLTSPLPAIITRDPYQVVRATTMMPAVYLTIACGLKGVSDFLATKGKKITIAAMILFGLVFGYFSIRYLDYFFRVYPVKYSESWQFGYKQAVEYAKENYSKYQRIVITKKYGEPHEFVYFYTLQDSKSLQTDPNLVRYPRSDWFWTDSFDKYVFMNDWEIKEKTAKMTNTLLITSPGNFPVGGQVVKTINFLDGTPSFTIVSLL